MNISRIEQAIGALKSLSVLAKLRPTELTSYDVMKQWFHESSSQIPNSSKNGLYFYTRRNGDLLYIGKGEYESGGGIGRRACAHLGKAVKDVEMFPQHQWKDDHAVDDLTKRTIATGDFLLWTLPIEPDYFISLFEVYLQTLCQDEGKGLPPLNKRIG